MEKEDINLYLQEINNASSEEEKLEISMKMVKAIYENVGKPNDRRYIVTKK